jgi:hypothetical protein
MRWIARLGASPWGPPCAALLALPALTSGLVIDDYLLRDRLHGADAIRWRGLWDAFSLATEGNVVAMRELGDLPWWSAPELRLSFFRPLAALTHALDFALLPPWLMHVESMLLLAALNAAVWLWYRRLYGEDHGLASLLFAVAPGHVFAASWLANRNAVLAALFSVLALLAYDRARLEARSTWPAAALLTLSLLAGEIGLGATALWIAYAACLDRAPNRLRGLAPGLLVTAAWLVLRTALDYGAQGSSLYVDPLREPLRFARALAEHMPLLVFGQLGFPCITFQLFLSRPAALVSIALALLVLALWVPRGRALLRQDARARFAALASLLALAPVAATAVHDRLLIVADVAGMGLLAQLLAMRSDRLARGWANARVALSLLLALLYAASLQEHIDQGERPFVEILRDPQVAAQSVVFVNAPCAFYPIQLRRLRIHEGGPVPRRVRTLASGLYPLALERRDEQTLRIHGAGGLLQPHGRYHAPGRQPSWFSRSYLAQTLDHFPRAKWTYRAGDRVELSELSVRVVAATADGYPERVDFVFRTALTNVQFLAWHAGSYRPFALPAVGEVVRIDARTF